ncbi:HpcH/HpaI aldolase/citrate lyase family protein [Sinobaca sp. H24]|uniref:HpcH/HpaI aldolase family protein n=1 Tax=Sinobaca sp. H24 TaxID=2923376 RepID=UPI00207A8464|nr:aldolase/citrate lyase family protein [Sinobaca sp. H24]
MFTNNVKEKIQNQELTQGAITSLYSPALVEMLGYAGYEFIVIDDEHGAYSGSEMEDMIRTSQLAGIVPIVRVSYDASSIQKALDRGAFGIQVPMVNTVEDAERAVSLAKYPPRGSRGTAFSMRAAGFGFLNNGQFMDDSDDNILVTVQIETVEAVKHFKEIMSVPGVDMAFLGPTDLSVNMGYKKNIGGPEVQETLDSLYQQAEEMNVPIGTIATSQAETKAVAEKGAVFVSLVVTTLIKKALNDSLIR